MSDVLAFKSKQRIRISGYTREEVHDLIAKWWKRKRIDRVKLANEVQAILQIQNGEMRMILKTFGITLETLNTISIHPNADYITVQINTYKPSQLLQCIWNVTIKYEYIDGMFLKITYDKRVSSCAMPGIDRWILYFTENQHKVDTTIMAKKEAKNMLELLQK
jgi:hypothetical protein